MKWSWKWLQRNGVLPRRWPAGPITHNKKRKKTFLQSTSTNQFPSLVCWLMKRKLKKRRREEKNSAANTSFLFNQLSLHFFLWSELMKKRMVCFGLPRSCGLLGAPFRNSNWIHGLIHSGLAASIPQLHSSSIELLHSLWNCLVCLIVLSLWRSPWLASQPITHQRKKSTNQTKQTKPIFSSFFSNQIQIKFIFNWICLIWWKKERKGRVIPLLSLFAFASFGGAPCRLRRA